MFKQHYEMFAAYNVWANDILYEAVAKLDEPAFTRDLGAFFGSVQRTLNHLINANDIWLGRFTGNPPDSYALDAVPFPHFPALAAARAFQDERIINYIDGLSEKDFAGSFSYPRGGEMHTQNLGPALAHFFNHHAHHRGQVHMMLTMLDQPSLTLDLVYFLRTDDGKQFA